MDGSYFDPMSQHIYTHGPGDGVDGKFTAAIHVAFFIDFLAGYAAEVNDMAVAGRDEQGKHGPAYIEESLYVGIDHGFPVFEVGFVEIVSAEGEAGIVDEDVYFSPFGWQAGDGCEDGCAILYVEIEGEDAGARGGVGGRGGFCGRRGWDGRRGGGGEVFEFVFQCLEPVFTAAGQNEMGAGGGKFPGAGFTEA